HTSPRAVLPVLSGIAGPADQDLTLAAVARSADDALALHALHQFGGAIVAHEQAPLQVAGRGLLVAPHDRNGAVIEVALRRPCRPRLAPGRFRLVRRVGDAGDVAGLALIAQVGGDPLH